MFNVNRVEQKVWGGEENSKVNRIDGCKHLRDLEVKLRQPELPMHSCISFPPITSAFNGFIAYYFMCSILSSVIMNSFISLCHCIVCFVNK